MRSRRLLFALVLVVVSASCSSVGSGNRPDEIAQPSINVARRGAMFFGSGDTAPVTLDVEIRNNADVALTVRQIELSSPGMVQYALDRVTRHYGDTLAPGASQTFRIGTTAYTDRTRLNATEPLNVRAIVDFEHDGRRFREIYLVGVLE